MTAPDNKYQIAEALRIPIAIVSEQGAVKWRNATFDMTFGSDASAWLNEAARTVGGERGWLQAFFLPDTGELVSIDVEIEGRIFRVDKIKDVHDYEVPAVALWIEDVTHQREMEQAKSDFTAQIVHDLRGPLSGIQGTLEFVLSQEGSKLDSMYADLLQEA